MPKPQEDGSEADFSVNFFSEPNKSKKQIQKLFDLVRKHIVSRDDYMKIIKQLNPEVHIIEENPMEPISMLRQDKKPFVSLSEEKARILVRVFGRKTSVLYDVKSLSEMLSAENQSDQMREMIAQTIFISMASIKQCIITQANSKEAAIFRKYWELCITSLPLAKLNEMIQSNRDNQRIVDPLLKSTILLGP